MNSANLLNDLAGSKLEEPFTEEEAHIALLNLKGDKAPRT